MGLLKKLRRRIFAGRYATLESLKELRKIAQELREIKLRLEGNSYLAVPGWFDFPEVYTRLAGLLKDGDCCVEVGSYLGQSCVFLGQQIKARKLDCLIYAVDIWADRIDKEENAETRAPLFYDFISNCQKSGILDIVRTIQAPSLQAASSFTGPARFVFIDANHSYEHVCADIDAWMTKVLPDGMIAGHDYYNNPSDWPGVKKAVDEKFSKIEVIGACWLAKPSDYRAGKPPQK